MEENIIRSLIFLVAGLLIILFPKKIKKMQSYVVKKLNVACSDSENSLRMIGVVFLIIAAALFMYSKR
ncbi:hypothetical protein CMO91_02150 [Candidatus Woesearchaeota archaeon]|nr:hypothetical protein [Candidatus Woesearchaeota archaeon]|tara:strand:- start:304 stop:507 length:204 start_codon:yes stop_codon:yes gene_type:complete